MTLMWPRWPFIPWALHRGGGWGCWFGDGLWGFNSITPLVMSFHPASIVLLCYLLAAFAAHKHGGPSSHSSGLIFIRLPSQGYRGSAPRKNNGLPTSQEKRNLKAAGFAFPCGFQLKYSAGNQEKCLGLKVCFCVCRTPSARWLVTSTIPPCGKTKT